MCFNSGQFISATTVVAHSKIGRPSYEWEALNSVWAPQCVNSTLSCMIGMMMHFIWIASAQQHKYEWINAFDYAMVQFIATIELASIYSSIVCFVNEKLFAPATCESSDLSVMKRSPTPTYTIAQSTDSRCNKINELFHKNRKYEFSEDVGFRFIYFIINTCHLKSNVK